MECLLTCRTLAKQAPLDVTNAVLSLGFALTDADSLQVFGDDRILPVFCSESLPALGEYLSEHPARVCIVRVVGSFADIKTRLRLDFDFENNVLVLAVPEDFLWGFSAKPELARFERLLAFANCCRQVMSIVHPEFLYLDTELLHPEDVRIDRAENAGAVRVGPETFSEASLRELFEWYVNVYTKRWD